MRRLAAALLLATLLTGCGGGDDETSPESLKSRLLPASELPGFKVSRTFEWDNPIDLTAQGFFLPESTPPSEVVEVAEEAGFEAGVGEQLEKGRGTGMSVIAAKFASSDGARDMLERLHREDLQQPCYGVCSQIQSDLPVSGIPDATGAQSLPDPNPPPNAPEPFMAYGVEFTVGPYLYVVSGATPAPVPGSAPGITKEQVLDAAAAQYARVKDEG